MNACCRSASTGDPSGGSGGGSPQPHHHLVVGSRQHSSLTTVVSGNPYVQHGGGGGGGHFSQDVMDGGNSRVLRQQITVPQERVVIGLQLTSLDMIEECEGPSIHT